MHRAARVGEGQHVTFVQLRVKLFCKQRRQRNDAIRIFRTHAGGEFDHFRTFRRQAGGRLERNDAVVLLEHQVVGERHQFGIAAGRARHVDRIARRGEGNARENLLLRVFRHRRRIETGACRNVGHQDACTARDGQHGAVLRGHVAGGAGPTLGGECGEPRPEHLPAAGLDRGASASGVRRHAEILPVAVTQQSVSLPPMASVSVAEPTPRSEEPKGGVGAESRTEYTPDIGWWMVRCCLSTPSQSPDSLLVMPASWIRPLSRLSLPNFLHEQEPGRLEPLALPAPRHLPSQLSRLSQSFLR